jgi:signal transduction histidine kinase/AraC-like DNA-binding protein
MKATILVIDDEPQFERLILQRFRKKVKTGEYHFLFALNGLEALEIIRREEAIDVVLTDINMPEMDGLTFLAELKNLQPSFKTIVVSAYGDMKNIRTAMNLGAFDFVTKPIEFLDLEATIEKTIEESMLLRKAALAQELEQQNEHLQELDALKTQFFTNISHEFRTPLTVISGMADQIEEAPDRWMKKGIKMIRRSTHSLLGLVNQILDLRKLEAGKMPYQPILSDVVPYLKYLCESYQSIAESQDITLNYTTSIDRLEMDYDPEHLLRIISNLLGNALKFTPPGGAIFFTLEKIKNHLQVSIRDTGIGIDPEKLPHIFERFYNTDYKTLSPVKGSGIGLALVKELIHLMDGDIQVDSVLNEGTTLTFRLPIKQKTAKSATPLPTVEEWSTTDDHTTFSIDFEEKATDLPRVLIVEDNEDVAQYLMSFLEGLYQLSFAPNGQIGIEMALEQIPDMIISDVMMPLKDGYELCETLKKDRLTSHIPIILLTAKADTASRIEGLQYGADAYLFKPFERKELLVRIEKLLELRNQLQSYYSPENDTLLATTPQLERENEFIKELRQLINHHIDDEDLSISDVCKAMAMSRTQLHRKIKALTGRSTSHFIRRIRLLKAKEILKETDFNISQVAYEVGFKDPKYFSRSFTEEFGVSPKETRK